ncbi:hypothetical protein GUITHDRAFT_136345 [Guillardia theta CCMP2712]|uniref:Uncharacterized protein n=1 Tax=Guillardia theta (strain CCMP2712) TaxID=905079 RepID=L1JLH1_GUITC|nr:hypothetical protein GUITHDRAFT_136345 [Guillardia theta CCMP2712]EKX49197.1 hypothetical protein GUITHDRAFT_136345 [Guillardia theta CCMP2712]|eukprot:XP_005836177.1 hypothetical protein GUITHDRAFT_136345 [Guillardia theta CCMP2712]
MRSARGRCSESTRTPPTSAHATHAAPATTYLLACFLLSFTASKSEESLHGISLTGTSGRASRGQAILLPPRRLLLHGGRDDDSEPPGELLESLKRENSHLRGDEWFFVEKKEGRYQANGPCDGDWIIGQMEFNIISPETFMWRPGMTSFERASALSRFLPTEDVQTASSCSDRGSSAISRALPDEAVVSDEETKEVEAQQELRGSKRRKWKTRRVYVEKQPPRGEEEGLEQDSNYILFEDEEPSLCRHEEEEELGIGQQVYQEEKRMEMLDEERSENGGMIEEERSVNGAMMEEGRGEGEMKKKQNFPPLFPNMSLYKNLIRIPQPYESFPTDHKELREIGVIYLLR